MFVGQLIDLLGAIVGFFELCCRGIMEAVSLFMRCCVVQVYSWIRDSVAPKSRGDKPLRRTSAVYTTTP